MKRSSRRQSRFDSERAHNARRRFFLDRLAGRYMLWLTVLSGMIVFVMIAGLFLRARPILAEHTVVELLTSSVWRPMAGEFGFLPFIAGTLWVTGSPSS